jgi:hypothetical protein
VDKVAWLWEKGLLPLPHHQAYGTLLVKTNRVVSGYNPKSGATNETLRGVVEPVAGPVVEFLRTGMLWPERARDDPLRGHQDVQRD